ncbi:hypothetical protein C0991_003456 [Blastosporella zonata]|nr:hypothetical protein C0991_003456 [Blastosporella zonata]
MPRLLANPNEATCPNFASANYEEAREAMITDTVDNEVAVAQMVATWTATNNVDKRIWARQLQADLALAKETEHIARETQDREVTLRPHENETVVAEERKRNKAKYQDISKEAPPITTPKILPAYTTTRLHKGQYVELWYFTNKGMAWGINVGPVNKNVLSQTVDDNGNVAWAPTTTAKAAKDVKKDRDLSWEQLMMATDETCPNTGMYSLQKPPSNS